MSSRNFQRSPKSRQTMTYQIHGAVSAAGGTPAVIQGISEITVVDLGVGSYEIHFNIPFARVLSFWAQAVGATAAIIQIIGGDETYMEILALDATDGATPVDVDFTFCVTGSDSADQI